EDIADYLANTPEFFVRHASLLAQVHLTSPHSQRAVSLQERQAEMLREKIRVLEQRLMEMLRNGNDNLILSNKILRWAGSLLQCTEVRTLPQYITSSIAMQFDVPQVGVRLWQLASGYAQEPYAQGVSQDLKVFANSLTEPFCGLNTGFESIGWLEQPQGVGSLALIPLRQGPATAEQPAVGLLVLASSDTQRFSNGMGTEFLARIGELVSAALSRLHPDARTQTMAQK
ncbi:MAG: DUF484 family protein, partial [Rhodoferax sp.]|nr:DUF484 family protein [Rhodoferax sp.]